MTKRRRITKAIQLRVWRNADGKCHICKKAINVGEKWEVEHRTPLSMGGADTEENLSPAHILCHKQKSQTESPVRAKADRIAQKHRGIKSPEKGPKLQSRGFPAVEKDKTCVDKKGLPPLPRRSLYEDIK